MLELFKAITTNKKEIIIFALIMLIAILLLIGTLIHFPIPSPTEFIGELLDPIVKPIEHWIKGES
jgi:hypothetical protein